MGTKVEERLFEIEKELKKVLEEVRAVPKRQKDVEERLKEYRSLLETSRKYRVSVDVTAMLRGERDKREDSSR